MKSSRYCITQWIPKLLGGFEIHWVRQYLVKKSFISNKGLLHILMTIKLKSNLYMGPSNIFPNFLPCHEHMLQVCQCPE